MTDQKKPKKAATVILLRPGKPSGFEVFLTRRPVGMVFLGGMYCFPGGAVTKEDGSAGMLDRCQGLSATDARKIVGAHFSPREALALWVAGMRELFEETGILVAVREDPDSSKEERRRIATIAEKHAKHLQSGATFQSMLRDEKLLCDASKLAYFSYWLTPAQFPVRFDTRFFLAALPDYQNPLAISSEVAHSVWLTPDRALQLFAKDELPMIFPTFASLRMLADYDTLDSLLEEYRLSQ
jgi:8-oxo-dGTP pyrophosphatase MutT (NUDIX family)